MPSDFLTLIGLAVAAVVVLWLVFSVLKKVIGLVVLAAIAGVAAVLWLNPALAQQIWSSFQLLIGAR